MNVETYAISYYLSKKTYFNIQSFPAPKPLKLVVCFYFFFKLGYEHALQP